MGTSGREALDYMGPGRTGAVPFDHTLPSVTYKSHCQGEHPFVFLTKGEKTSIDCKCSPLSGAESLK